MRRITVMLLLLLAIAVGGFLISHRQPSVALVAGCVDIPASPDYLSSKSEADAIAAIDNARSEENLPALRLPANYYRLGPAQQQLILINLERTDRRPCKWMPRSRRWPSPTAGRCPIYTSFPIPAPSVAPSPTA